MGNERGIKMNDMKKKRQQARKLINNLLELPENYQVELANMINSVAALERFKAQRSRKTA